MKRTVTILFLLAALAAVVLAFRSKDSEEGRAPASSPGPAVVPVEAAAIERGPIELRRSYSGTLEASAKVEVAAKVAGRLERIAVDLGDVVSRGEVVATLDDDEFALAVREAEADLAVARASLAEAASALEIAERAVLRAEALREGGVTSESQLDNAKAEEIAGRARVQVATAVIARAEAALEAARIRLADTRVTADWSPAEAGADARRVVAERFVDEGGLVTANAPLLAIVGLDPLIAAVYVPERDYANLALDQEAELRTDSHSGRVFRARVARIAPVFRSATRQARVELLVENADSALKPGMFARATIELERVAAATIVPFDALCERAGENGVFVLSAAGDQVRWVPVAVGIRDGDRVQVSGADLTGRVVTLGQELCEDGSRVRVAERPE